jgi:hypothetical protein
MKNIFILILFVSSFSLFAAQRSFLPENNLEIGIDELAPTGISEADFNIVQKELADIYVPIAAAQGGKLTFLSNWKDKTVNAYAQRFGHEDQDGEEHGPFDDWRVTFLGGLARNKHVTRDGFSLVVCHELGHHFGGSPSYDGANAWAANEGQADYYSVSKCLRRLWQHADNALIIKGQIIDPVLKSLCSTQWKTDFDQTLCLRGGLAAQSIGNLFASLVTFSKLPKFNTPDPTKVKKTVAGHPKAQCRLDTYFQATLCHVSFDQEFDKKDETFGACHPSHGDTVGNRPLCWYAPTL